MGQELLCTIQGLLCAITTLSRSKGRKELKEPLCCADVRFIGFSDASSLAFEFGKTCVWKGNSRIRTIMIRIRRVRSNSSIDPFASLLQIKSWISLYFDSHTTTLFSCSILGSYPGRTRIESSQPRISEVGTLRSNSLWPLTHILFWPGNLSFGPSEDRVIQSEYPAGNGLQISLLGCCLYS